MKFNYLQEVMPKKCGPPTVGRVVGSLMGYVWIDFFSQLHNRNLLYWDMLYAGWRTKPIIFVRFSKPQKLMTLEEYKTLLGDVSSTEAEVLYKYNCPVVPIAAYPIDDLEPLNDFIQVEDEK